MTRVWSGTGVRMTTRGLRLVALCALLLMSSCGTESRSSAGSGKTVPWRQLVIERLEKQARGNVAIEDAVGEQERVFDSTASWRSFWEGYRVEAIPDVDFEAERALLVSLGTKGPGWMISIDEITEDPNDRSTTVNLLEQHPNPAKVYATVLIYPAVAVAFRASSGSVKIIRTVSIDPI